MTANKWAVPEYSKHQVNRAGEIIISSTSTQAEKELALIVINNWRSSHNFPLNTFQWRLRKLAREINSAALIAQRIKRLASIKHKLERFNGMKLAQIQDIGGCRAILQDVNEVEQLVNIYLHASRGVKHKLDRKQDYIQEPKESGYRGVHLIYKYQSDKSKVYKDLKIEIQIRSLLQHAWATAVETVGTFIQQSLKSSQGEEDWLLFFKLMSSAFAIKEGKPIVPKTCENIADLKKQIIQLSEKLNVEVHLTAFRHSVKVLAERRINNAHYYLIELDADDRTLTIKSYAQTQLTIASNDYITIEKRILGRNRDAVLVSADSIEALKLAFPNYYLDTDLFLTELKEIVAEDSQTSLF